MARADKFTYTGKQLELYSDFLIDFSINPVTGLLARVTNEEAIKQSIKNLVLTTFTERPYHPLLGSQIKTSLMEPLDPTSQEIIRSTIETSLKQEPRARIIGINVTPLYDDYAMSIEVQFTSINIPNRSFSVNLTLDILR